MTWGAAAISGPLPHLACADCFQRVFGVLLEGPELADSGLHQLVDIIQAIAADERLYV